MAPTRSTPDVAFAAPLGGCGLLRPDGDSASGRSSARRPAGAVQAVSWPRVSIGDRGAATLELVVLFPVLLLLIFGVFQGALYFHSRNVALAPAQQGVRGGRANGQSDPAGTAVGQAREFLAQTGELHDLTGLQITPTVSGGQLRITITGRALSLLPGVAGPHVSQTAAGSLERFTHSSGGRR